jgi:hypothetical protein
MENIQEQIDRLIQDGGMTDDQANDAIAMIIDRKLPLKTMVNLLIASRKGLSLEVKHILTNPSLISRLSKTGGGNGH